MQIIRLNLGSRDRKMNGYKNMDIEPHPGVHYVGDVRDLSRFKDGAVSEIFASNILEHFPHPQTVNVLKEWHRALGPGGVLYVSVPDFARAIEIYEQYGLQDWIQNFLCGDQTYDTAFHYAIFDRMRLNEQLRLAGFDEVDLVESFWHADEKDCSNLRSTADGKIVSLNMIARKKKK